MFKNLIIAGLGGAIGTIMRFGIYLLFKTSLFPYATLIINIIGSLMIGMVIGISLKDEVFSNNWKIFLATGICGGFTTFSAFSMENLTMIQQSRYLLSLVYIVGSVTAGIVATWVGYRLGIK